MQIEAFVPSLVRRVPTLLALFAPIALAPRSAAQTTSAVSVDTGGQLSDGFSFHPSVSADGSRVAFASLATNLVANDSNFATDVFVHDRTSATTICASVDASGAPANGISWFPAISGNGGFVAFTSLADSLVAGDTNGKFDVFVRDLAAGQTMRVSVDSSGAQADLSLSLVAISSDGRIVAFDGDATNLVSGDSNGVSDVFVHDRLTGQTTCVSLDPTGATGNGESTGPSISADGRFVAFASFASNLVAGDANGAVDVFVHDRQTGQTVLASVDASGTQGDNDSSYPALSADGLVLAFESLASNFAAGDSNAQTDVFVRDLQSGQLQLVSVAAGGAPGAGLSAGASISGNGRYVSFYSASTDVVPGTGFGPHVFVRDVVNGVTTLASIDPNGAPGDDSSYFSSLSAGGEAIAFESVATNLIAGDGNFAQDVFVRGLVNPAFDDFCHGDGTFGAPSCPCGNDGAPGRGCDNSAATGGAKLVCTGTTSPDTVQMTANGELATSLSIFLQGDAEVAPAVAFGDGLRCAAGSLKRLYVKSAVGGVAVAPVGGDLAIRQQSAVLGDPIAPGTTRASQVYYRDPTLAFCPFPQGNSWNATHAVRILGP